MSINNCELLSICIHMYYMYNVGMCMCMCVYMYRRITQNTTQYKPNQYNIQYSIVLYNTIQCSILCYTTQDSTICYIVKDGNRFTRSKHTINNYVPCCIRICDVISFRGLS